MTSIFSSCYFYGISDNFTSVSSIDDINSPFNVMVQNLPYKLTLQITTGISLEEINITARVFYSFKDVRVEA